MSIDKLVADNGTAERACSRARVSLSWADVDTRVYRSPSGLPATLLVSLIQLVKERRTLWVVGPDDGATLSWVRVGSTVHPVLRCEVPVLCAHRLNAKAQFGTRAMTLDRCSQMGVCSACRLLG